MFRRIVLYLKGLRGSRGFGVHSPFAFEFVLNVLRDRHPFYAYTRMERLHREACGAGRPPLWLMKLFFRISARLDLKDIRIVGAVDRLLVDALLMPSERMSVVDAAGSQLLVVGRDVPVADADIIEEICAVVGGYGSAIVIGHCDIIDMLVDRMDHGMIFTNGYSLSVIVGHRHLPVQRYIVRFS